MLIIIMDFDQKLLHLGFGFFKYYFNNDGITWFLDVSQVLCSLLLSITTYVKIVYKKCSASSWALSLVESIIWNGFMIKKNKQRFDMKQNQDFKLFNPTANEWVFALDRWSLVNFYGLEIQFADSFSLINLNLLCVLTVGSVWPKSYLVWWLVCELIS